MESTMNQLDEVVRRYNNINAVSLGLFQQTKNLYASWKENMQLQFKIDWINGVWSFD
jgi:hypothetical protein